MRTVNVLNSYHKLTAEKFVTHISYHEMLIEIDIRWYVTNRTF